MTRERIIQNIRRKIYELEALQGDLDLLVSALNENELETHSNNRIAFVFRNCVDCLGEDILTKKENTE